MFCWFSATVVFSHTKSAPATSQPAVLFSYSKSAPATSHSQQNRVMIAADSSLGRQMTMPR